jgi:hypothetical protein
LAAALDPGIDEAGHMVRLVRVGDDVIHPVQRDERRGPTGGDEHATGLPNRDDRVERRMQDEQRVPSRTGPVAGEPIVTTARIPDSDGAAARTDSPAAEWPTALDRRGSPIAESAARYCDDNSSHRLWRARAQGVVSS